MRYTQLTQEERYQISALLQAGYDQTGIAMICVACWGGWLEVDPLLSHLFSAITKAPTVGIHQSGLVVA